MTMEAECGIALQRLTKAHNEQQAAWAALIKAALGGIVGRKDDPHHAALHERWDQALLGEEAAKAEIERLRRIFRGR